MADARQSLDTLLATLGEASRFVTDGSLPPVLPGLEVKGVGAIGCPVTPADARQLIAQAAQAPYGRGEETLVDPNVRRVWQLEPSQFTLRNAAWGTHLADIVKAVKEEFGIAQKVHARLYKLLVYEKGSFFAPHRDSEKTPGMFATLVVCLPSRHEGGTLIVTHDGQTRRIDFGGKDSEFQTQYAAFYADCRHEIKPVTAGYRLCLVYNLALAGKKQQPAAPQQAATVQDVARLLQKLFAEPSGDRTKLAIPFRHQYTEAGLAPRQLKGSDRTLFDVVTRAAESLDYQCYLALLTYYQAGDVDYSSLDFDPYSGRRSYGWSDYEDDEDEDADDADLDADMGEVFEEELTLDHWLDPQGQKQPFGMVHLEECELLSEEDKDGWSIRQEVHEATGNEGVSMERWYRQGVLVLWPRDRYFTILAGEGQASALPALEKMAVRSKKPEALERCRSFAAQILRHWKPGLRLDRKASYTGRMLHLLERVGTAELVESFLRDVLPRDFDGSEGKVLARLCQQFGWPHFAAALRNFLALQKPRDYRAELANLVSICEALCCAPPALTQERRAVCAALAEELERVVERWDARKVQPWEEPDPRRAQVVEDAVRIFATLALPEQLERFAEHVLADQKHYDLHEALIPGVKAIHHWLPKVPAAQPAAARLVQHCLRELRVATAQPVEPPGDWKREAKLGCTCADCQTLARFLRDPAQRVGRFPLRKERRQHLHQQLDRHQCDCTHVTERVGSPQTLVCTKTQASYERRQKQYAVDKKLLAELEALAGVGSRAAVKRTPGRRPSKK